MDEFPAEFWRGVEEFNRGAFYACHDTLEALWIEAVEPEKTLYQGILQIAVALYHLENLNWRGAVILLGEGLHRLSRYPDEYDNLDLGHLRDRASSLLSLLQTLGPENVATFKWCRPGDLSTALSTDREIQHDQPIVQKVRSTP
jgi:uncharacterized protein